MHSKCFISFTLLLCVVPQYLYSICVLFCYITSRHAFDGFSVLFQRPAPRRTPGRTAAERSLLTAQNRAARLQFARRQLELHPDEAYWRSVIFTDEKTFDTASHGRQIVYRRDGTRFHPQHVAQRQVSGRVTVHCWGWMDGQGRGSLHRLGPHFNQYGYIDLLQEHFLPEVRRTRQSPYRLQQDHSPVRMVRRVRVMLAAEEDLELVPATRRRSCLYSRMMWPFSRRAALCKSARTGSNRLWMRSAAG